MSIWHYVYTFFHSYTSTDSDGEDEGKQKGRTGDRSSPRKVAGSNMAVANDCEPCKGVTSPNGVAHSRYPENLINEENWTSGST